MFKVCFPIGVKKYLISSDRASRTLITLQKGNSVACQQKVYYFLAGF